ncbi:LLM class flavin-dependent oxidoreductase [Pengzhenrongella sicca]|uniref:LLM class flavin-dependent oxidoreductase n=1 Tax=Pengzhenrongella sicca TaxID=2819238 RepID=A0A8A4Z7S8_9MICO|nr:LLM class flavin-dependent oxidoreductase [Pengzhenrongella sicca]QTE27902.1 LLM class flavin-dependent oxidoreductase [Pengzhenrongella sicca]
MKFGIVASSGSTDQVLEMAQAAERAGWDGFFTWDGISVGPGDTFDPWTLLGAVAATTSTIRLGAMVFSIPRRKPWEVARQALTVDHLSGGRLVLPVGLGATDDGAYSRVSGESTDRKVRAEQLDDALAILDLAWTGEPFSFEGTHTRVRDLVFRPRPVQRPRIPVWVVAAWPAERSMRRAVGREGIIPIRRGDPFTPLGPVELGELAAWVDAHRDVGAGPIEIVLEGVLPDDPAVAAAHASMLAGAGVTWWIESRWEGAGATPEALLARIRQGPPDSR